jgi:hypothetical protein
VAVPDIFVAIVYVVVDFGDWFACGVFEEVGFFKY